VHGPKLAHASDPSGRFARVEIPVARLSMFDLQRGTDGYQGIPSYWWVAKCRDGTHEVGIACAPDDMPAVEILLRSATPQ
jgi:hypothetical protein